jgi:hypothetical protein
MISLARHISLYTCKVPHEHFLNDSSCEIETVLPFMVLVYVIDIDSSVILHLILPVTTTCLSGVLECKKRLSEDTHSYRHQEKENYFTWPLQTYSIIVC